MTNLLQLGLRSKWGSGATSEEFECHSGFLKRKRWLCKDDAAVPVPAACTQRTEQQDEIAAHKSPASTCTDKRDKCLQLQPCRHTHEKDA